MNVEAGGGLRLRLERVIAAPQERVYAAWTEPELVQQWSAPVGLTVESGSMEVHPGGHWEVVMVEPGGTRHEAFGTYTVVQPPELLVYTHAWRREGGSTAQTEVTVEFRAEGGATRVVLTQTGFEAQGSRDGHEEGWSSTLDSLESFLARAT